jgi:hypothetical protein
MNSGRWAFDEAGGETPSPVVEKFAQNVAAKPAPVQAIIE